MGTDTKDKLLRAAVQVFAEKGFKRATVREIVQLAGALNLNSVVYYFGGKQGLYKAVLEFMFEEADKFRGSPAEEASASKDPEEHLRYMILYFCRVMYGIESETDRHLFSIFVKEVANPSPHLDEMVERFIKPSDEYMSSILRDYLGRDTPESVIQKCKYSLSAQIMHYALAWTVISRADPDHKPLEDQIEELSDHIIVFSLGGLDRIKAALERGEF